MLSNPSPLGRLSAVFLVVFLVVTAGGCVGLVANLMHVGMGNLVQPQFADLVGRRVAVVCVSSSSSFGPTTAAEEIAKRVQKYLKEHVPDIKLTSQQEVADWMDRHDWNFIDYREVGEGVAADMLVAIEIKSYSLHEGPTLYKGRADVRVAVHDMALDGEVVYEQSPPQIQYPVNSEHHTADVSEEEFSRIFADVVANRVARQFYAYEVAEDFGRDRSVIGF